VAKSNMTMNFDHTEIGQENQYCWKLLKYGNLSFLPNNDHTFVGPIENTTLYDAATLRSLLSPT